MLVWIRPVTCYGQREQKREESINKKKDILESTEVGETSLICRKWTLLSKFGTVLDRGQIKLLEM